ncbi:hypothetical protein PSTG_18382 [Puccinia striiformis f. sp. tritici PST-78]|uniref:Uncharacterized protein n=1 Tax=Puccinia striiformis f. sp. tritici PST-78 TaxID=1165861 RepID=A0A0L0UMH8_9BASI|nr:hypothetical protein PSTG_18382 [Puccinia striiformis f. sp. tritici PST-78]
MVLTSTAPPSPSAPARQCVDPSSYRVCNPKLRHRAMCKLVHEHSLCGECHALALIRVSFFPADPLFPSARGGGGEIDESPAGGSPARQHGLSADNSLVVLQQGGTLQPAPPHPAS